MFPFQAVAMQMRILMQVKQHCELPDQLWNAFVNMAGNLGGDLKLLAVLVAAALQLPDGSVLAAVQESRVEWCATSRKKKYI